MTIPIPTGVFDIVPEDQKDSWKNSYLWSYVENVMIDVATSYGCEEIRTPIFERYELFKRSVGDTTDIVSKEMYAFTDKGGRELSLRPEGTASVMRALIEKRLYEIPSCKRLFYIGPMFRYERPQAGRFRQHHQFGVEIVGSKEPQQDAELIEMLFSLYEKLGLKNLTVYINSLGDKESRQNFRAAFREYLRPYFNDLSQESKVRFELNPLRILDSKDPKDQELVVSAPSILDFLSPELKDHFEKVQKYLDALSIPYIVNNRLARGLDYYHKTVFEITSGELGAQNTVGAGGRYDGLTEDLGGPHLPTLGFATGIERVIQTMLAQHKAIPEKKKPDLYLIPLGEDALVQTMVLTKSLRRSNIHCIQEMSGKKLKGAMQQAVALSAEFTVVLGENELKTGFCELKEMATGEIIRLPLSSLESFFLLRSNKPLINSFCSFLNDSKESLKSMKKESEKINCSLEELKKTLASGEGVINKL